MGEVFANLLHTKLIKYLEENNIIKNSQHDFSKRKSTASLLANLYERIAREKGTNRKTLVTIVTRDVKKAFDKVWHNAIRLKLLRAGVEENLIRIISNFLQEKDIY